MVWCTSHAQQTLCFGLVARIRRVGNEPLKLPDLRTLLAVGDGDCTRCVGGGVTAFGAAMALHQRSCVRRTKAVASHTQSKTSRIPHGAGEVVS